MTAAASPRAPRAATVENYGDVRQEIGRLQGAMKAAEDRADRTDGQLMTMEAAFNKRFDDLAGDLEKLSAQSRQDKAELAGGLQDIRNILLERKARAGLGAWLLARFEFLAGIGAGLAGALIAGRH